MADGEIVTAFRSLAADAGQAGATIGDSMGEWLAKTADIADENADRTLAADGDGADAFSKIRPNAGSSAAGVGGPNRFAAMLSGGSESDVNKQIDDTLQKVNPKYEAGEYFYEYNCQNCVQTYELLRRAQANEPLRREIGDVEARPAPIEGPQKMTFMENRWHGKFQDGSKADIEKAFSEPGSRGVVWIEWSKNNMHVFNVENAGGKVRFIDGQPTPPLTDASHFFDKEYKAKYMRLDDKPIPQDHSIRVFAVRNEPSAKPLPAT